jgi:hypothetical protein
MEEPDNKPRLRQRKFNGMRHVPRWVLSVALI